MIQQHRNTTDEKSQILLAQFGNSIIILAICDIIFAELIFNNMHNQPWICKEVFHCPSQTSVQAITGQALIRFIQLRCWPSSDLHWVSFVVFGDVTLSNNIPPRRSALYEWRYGLTCLKGCGYAGFDVAGIVCWTLLCACLPETRAGALG